MNGDFLNILVWWFAFLIIGMVSAPLTLLIFKNQFLSTAFSKTLGFIFITFIIFILSSLKILPFSTLSIYLILSLWIAINIIILAKNRVVLFKLFKKSLRVILIQETLFTLGLIFWSYVRAHQPDILGLEKLMDFGFINSILRTEYLPPTDMWFAGKSINYYWFGHLWVAIATKLTQIPSSITYNLMLATIMGLTLTGGFAIASFLFSNISSKVKIRTIFAVGLISAFALTFAGNFHTALYVFKDGKEKYWYPDATRFIGYNPETNDKTIHEFPIYSFIVSDLHPHLINLPFVLLFIGLLVSFMKDFDSFNKRKATILGFMLGIFFMANTWDFGNYFLVSGITIFIFNLIKHRISLKTIINIVLQGGIMILSAILTSLPFILRFESIAQGIALVKTHTPIWQLSILWGFPAIVTILYLLSLIRESTRRKSIAFPDIISLTFLTSAWILIALPEIIYVKDIYTSSFYRANTMFKLTYQAFVIFYTLSGFVVIRTLVLFKELKFKIPLIIVYTAIFGAIFMYPSFGLKSYYSDLKNYNGLVGDVWATERYPEVSKAIDWFNNNVGGQPVILEAPGDSYTDFNLISSYTGLPTVSGWFVHEWLWRGDSKYPQERVGEIDNIYKSEDLQLTKNLLEKYNVKYLIIGPFERQKFQKINDAKFLSLGKIVFQTPGLTVYEITN